MGKNVVLIMSGYNNRAVVSFCRFCEKNDISFFIIAMGEDDIINFTEYSKYIILKRKSKALHLDDFLLYKNKIKEKHDIDKLVVLPSSEFLNRFLLDNLTELEENNFIVPLTDEKLYQEVSDKYSFCELCEKNDIRIPKEYRSIDEANIPFVAKPKQYFIDGKITNEKPVLIMNKGDYESFNQQKNKDDFYYQEFVGGDSFYLLYYFSKNGEYSVFSQKNLIQQDNGLSIIGAKSSDFHHNNIADKYADLFVKKGFVGLIMIEVKAFNDEVYMIEANPRLWGPSQLILDANMDLFYKFALDFGLINEEYNYSSIYKEDITYFWSGGIHQDLDNNNQPVFHQYDELSFFNEYQNWVQNDVYLKEDSISVYFSELKKDI
ncbi:hypothetical protein [Psychroserpens ponticola]|uniref:Carbamoyl phosphate synthase ATP-binding domain-containing protein n=1 Tax=Psychroserpens ponticola TaxID=2932268 RepID=A0ABY7RZM1_9FLAO|nr:hypothetical protein [Psychroserpens ponticola]WCO01140.1 hypothetical protein MUN68_013835 [Psychroserpens ponticola]